MEATIKVEVVSAEQHLWSGEGTMVFAPAASGEVGIAPKHTQMLSPLKAGDVRVLKQDGEEEFFFVSGGLMEVQPHQVTILSDTAIRAEDLDEARALESQKRAEQAMQDNKSAIEFAQAKMELAQAAAQIRAIQKLRGKR